MQINSPDDGGDTRYINTTDYKDLADKLDKLVGIISDLMGQNEVARRLRYSEIDVEAERKTGKIAPDELLISQHIIDTNIRREQSSYVQYTSQSPRAIILQNPNDLAQDCSVLEKDVTNKLRFPDWQIPMFATIDGMQQNGYGVMEIVADESLPGGVGHESVQLGDFAFAEDTRNIQQCEQVMRAYYFAKTTLLDMCSSSRKYPFVKEQVDKLISTAPKNEDANPQIIQTDRTLYKIFKVMFRVSGIVHVAWCCPKVCDDWIRAPRPLFLGRRSEPIAQSTGATVLAPQQPTVTMDSTQGQQPQTQEEVETSYPYVIFPYLISENNVIQQLKGRVYLDQDVQEAATSLVSSFCTGHRRASTLMFGKDGDDPNTILQDENIYFKQGLIMKQKVKQFQLQPPDSTMVQAISLIVSSNQNETSQVNFAVHNRKDSRKTATEISAATAEAGKLTTVQVVLFSNSLRTLYQTMFTIIQSRVKAGLIIITNQEIRAMYNGKYIIKPAGDVDVIERQQIVQAQMNAWPVVQSTPIGPEFFLDMMSNMFPQYATKYVQMFKNAMAQQQQAQQQAQQNGQIQMMQVAKQIGSGIIKLSKSPEMFSDTGKIHALPKVEEAANVLENMFQQMQNNNQPVAQQ